MIDEMHDLRRALFPLFLLALAGCGKPPLLRHYTLTLTLPQVLTQATTGPGPLPALPSLEVRRLSVHDPYAQSRMVYRSSPYRVDFDDLHLWASPPAEQVSNGTIRYLRASGLFNRVLGVPYTPQDQDLILGGAVRQFEEIDRKDSWEAALGIDFWLLRAGDQRPFWFHSYQATRRAARRNPEAVAEAMSRALEQVLQDLVADLRSAVAAGALDRSSQKGSAP